MKRKGDIREDIIRWCIVVGVIVAVMFVASYFRKPGDDKAAYAERLTPMQEDSADGDGAGMRTGNDTNESAVMEKYSGTELSGLTVVLDAGHGGKDIGASSMGSEEKDINLDFEKKIAGLLESCGAVIIETRSDDIFISLRGRVDIANNSAADLFVSVHCNYYDEDASMNGFQCFYGGGSAGGKAAADSITEKVESDGMCSTKHARPENYYVVRNTTMTAVLIELGYMSNRTECIHLLDDEYQDKMAGSIVSGIIGWYSGF